MSKTKIWSLVVILIASCIIAILTPAVRQIINIKFVTGSRTYIGWILSDGLNQRPNQWHITTDKITVVGTQWSTLDPNSRGTRQMYSDYYAPGTRLFKIPGINPLNAIAVQQPDGSYVLAMHTDTRPSNHSFEVCEGWIVPKDTNSSGHYTVINGPNVKVGHVIGNIGTKFISNAFPQGTPVYTINGLDPKIEIAIGYPTRWPTEAIWTPTPPK